MRFRGRTGQPTSGHVNGGHRGWARWVAPARRCRAIWTRTCCFPQPKQIEQARCTVCSTVLASPTPTASTTGHAHIQPGPRHQPVHYHPIMWRHWSRPCIPIHAQRQQVELARRQFMHRMPLQPIPRPRFASLTILSLWHPGKCLIHKATKVISYLGPLMHKNDGIKRDRSQPMTADINRLCPLKIVDL